MAYKVFFVEDEIVTREGIRDNVDWKANGLEFCGEATDGEMALPLIQTIKPDVLITDIKMPFMDGLQLCKIIRGRMPWIKIIILSGHDEFEYAQEAIKLGVSGYLLKPVTVQDMNKALQIVVAQLSQEQQEQEKLKKLQEQLADNQFTLKEKFLLKVVVGAVTSTEAIEKSQSLGLNLVARCYLVVILRIELGDRSDQFDYNEYQNFLNIVSSLVEGDPDSFLSTKDWQELIILMKGNTPQYLEEQRDMLLNLIKSKLEKTRYQLTIGVGAPKDRISDIHLSFIEALVGIQKAADLKEADSNQAVDKAELLNLDKSAVGTFLNCGIKEGFDDFFDAYISPLGETTFRSYLIKNYIFVDVVLATAKLVNELGGDIDQVIPELNFIEMILTKIQSTEQLKEQVRKILFSAMTFRDNQTGSFHARLIRQTKEYIDTHYMETNLSLNEVASQVNLSPGHFSMVFSQESCQTFKEYLTEIRIKKAKEMLHTTSHSSTDISYQVGYNDPHYFSTVFKRQTGLSPKEFRLQIKTR
jgi:two-component system response regulator YesN